MDALAPEDVAANDPLLEGLDNAQDDGSGADAPVRFRTGNPSVQQWRGKVMEQTSSQAFIRLGERRPYLTLAC